MLYQKIQALSGISHFWKAIAYASHSHYGSVQTLVRLPCENFFSPQAETKLAVDTFIENKGGENEMDLNVIVVERKEDGQLVTIDERRWSQAMINATQHANFVVVGGQEYEMLEGRLNIEKQFLELLVLKVVAE